MAPSFVSNPDASLDSSRKKRRKLKDDQNSSATTQLRWRSDNEQRIYSIKLVEALQKVRQGPSSSTTTAVVSGGKTVKEAADRVLAVAARGTTRWSRAILTSRLRMRKRLQKPKKATVSGNSRCRRAEVRRMRMTAVQRKVKILSRLVPGCRKAPFPNLLEETTDYIAALQMQVRAMTVLTELLSGAPTAASRLNSAS